MESNIAAMLWNLHLRILNCLYDDLNALYDDEIYMLGVSEEPDEGQKDVIKG